MSQSTQQHRMEAKPSVLVAIITVSDSRTLENDGGGLLIQELLIAAEHRIHSRQIVPDEPNQLREVVQSLLADRNCQAILMTGGTGIGPRDTTPEAVEPLYEATIPGYGELFRMLSFQEIGAAALLSRASAGRVDGRVLFTMPGSPHGVRLAMEKLIVPDLHHFVHHASRVKP